MTIDKQAILNMFKDFHINYYYENDTDKVFTFTSQDNSILRKHLVNIDTLGDFYLDNGASKCVIIPSVTDYVIKLPYTGNFFESEDEEEEDYYQYFTEAVDGGNGWNYCEVEYHHYIVAKAAGMDKYLAPTIRIGYMANSGFPVYIQPKCKIFTFTNTEHSPEERKNTKENLQSKGVKYDLPIDWLIDFQNIYGEKELINFLIFLENEEWRDLRGDNVGYLNGKPVLVDYSDFWD